MSGLLLVFLGLAILGAGIAIGYAVASVKMAHHKARADAMGSAADEMEKIFKALAADVLRNSNQSFIELATQNLGKFQSEAKGDLEKRQQALSELVKPISDALQKTEVQIREIEKERKEAYGNISRYLSGMAETQSQLQAETRNLVQALRRPEVRGQWGEMTLRRLAELAGMVSYCDFFEQDTQDTNEGRIRPDMIVRMPDKRELVVDAKTPLDAYLSAVAAKTDEERKQYLQHHARKMRERMRELSSKAYWTQYKDSLDFVVMFVPGEQFLAAALDEDPKLMEDAFANKVVLASPPSLIALLRAVAFGWRQLALADNADTIRKLATDLYDRLSTFSNHLDDVGASLGKAVKNYNEAIGSLEHSVLPGARKFPEMGIQPKKEMPTLDPIEIAPRLTKPEDGK
ncbi:MAG TPA: DNA recombination protein RmuC [Gammaproteobacteria bacterium]|nr:DNA recombination protein RmuC [Gammaproteobacteria bacterium]